MIILAIETATEACSAALFRSGEVIERYAVAPRRHNQLVLPMIEQVLAEAGAGRSQIDAVAFGRGPGSFTGVRIAAGVTQGIAYALDRPAVPVSTLAALALQGFDETAATAVYASLDARMGEIYGALYVRGGGGVPELLGAERVLPAPLVEAGEILPTVGIGSGWATYREILKLRFGSIETVLEGRFPRAGHIARLGALDFEAGRTVDASEAVPVYLRDEVARKPAS